MASGSISGVKRDILFGQGLSLMGMGGRFESRIPQLTG